MNLSPATPPYDCQLQQQSLKRLFDSIDDHHDTDRPASPPDLIHEEVDLDFLSTPPLTLSPKHKCNNGSFKQRRKSVPRKSPSALLSIMDKSVVYQLNVANTTPYNCANNFETTPKIICGQSLLSALRKRVALARQLVDHSMVRNKRRSISRTIIIPKRHLRKYSEFSDDSLVANDVQLSAPQQQHHSDDENDQTFEKSIKKSTGRPSSSIHGRPSRVKGPCQACNEASDACMRKAFYWPLASNQIYNDKDKPFVYLCNKCGLRYNKSGGCVCRHCRWVLCKEEKRKALQQIDIMRRSKPDGQIDLDEEIENFACSPKYWSCGRKWKIGWILNSQHDEEDRQFCQV